MKSQKISNAEWQVMQIVWEQNPVTSGTIIDLLKESTSWSDATIKTLILRLTKKKVLGFKRQGRSYHYFPLAAKADCVRAERRSFLERVYGNAFKPMIAAFIDDQDLTEEDITELKKIIAEKEKQQK